MTNIIQRADAVREIARDGAQWIEANRAILKEDPSALARDFRRFARRAARLRVAAERPMCVAVFGASQAGKSYLVSSLATKPGEPLEAVYGDRVLNFLRDLNPPGGKEATGLVSRFTVRAPPAPAAAPVPVRLLSQTDTVKILANAYLADFKVPDLKPPEPEAVSAMFDKLAASATTASASTASATTAGASMGPDDIEEMREYFAKHFPDHKLLTALGPAYWARAADVIPRLSAASRAEAFAPLWANTAKLTRVAGELITALESIGNPDIAFLGLDALMPREDSVLDADRVFGLGDASKGMLRLTSSTGASASLDRAAVAALIAEITVPLRDQPWDFFEHTDLLDFPGARSREEIRHPDEFLAEPGRLGRVFLRGKVAYLFQRYNDEQEIAAMLLCVGPSNQDVQTLPAMIDDWIGQTMGKSPAARAVQRNSLFLVLTKFDSEFEEKAGEDVASGMRWTARLQASLLDFFGKSYDWPREWAPGRPFDNTTWLRSTAIGFDSIMDYATGPDGVKREAGIAPRVASKVAERRAIYLANPSIRAHVATPDQAWDEALRPADGGISYLAAKLRPVCDPATKAEQVSGRLEDLAVDMAQRLRPYFHTGDLAAELARARENARQVVRALVACAQAQMFGPFLRALQVTSDQMASVYWRLQSEPEDTAPIGTVSLADDYMGELGDFFGTPAPVAANGRGDAPAAARDRFEKLADLALSEWSDTMQAVADDGATPLVFKVPREQAATIVGEMWAAARRQGLRHRIAEDLRTRAGFQHRSAGAAQKPVILIESAINGFVHQLGFDRLPPAERPKIPNGSRTVFAPRAPVSGLPALGATPSPYDRTFHVDWMSALARTFEDNVADPGSSGLDIAANDALGKMLVRLEARRA